MSWKHLGRKLSAAGDDAKLTCLKKTLASLPEDEVAASEAAALDLLYSVKVTFLSQEFTSYTRCEHQARFLDNLATKYQQLKAAGQSAASESILRPKAPQESLPDQPSGRDMPPSSRRDVSHGAAYRSDFPCHSIMDSNSQWGQFDFSNLDPWQDLFENPGFDFLENYLLLAADQE
jgi:hypothetical protein